MAIAQPLCQQAEIVHRETVRHTIPETANGQFDLVTRCGSGNESGQTIILLDSSSFV